MYSELIVNVTSHETRVALMESGVLSELHIERESDKGIAGNIYKGRIQRVLPGMQAAFVDIGLARSAFLYVDDVYTPDSAAGDLREVFSDEQDVPEADDTEEFETRRHHGVPIEELLTDGREILVQVMKEPIGSKGARISSYISLPGRYLVYLPGVDNIFISRRITDPAERERLETVVKKIRPDACGFIVRTASEGASEDDLRMDMDFLVKLWDSIHARVDAAPAPCLLHEDLSVELRAIRDLYGSITKMIVDSAAVRQSIDTFMNTFTPQLKFPVELYEAPVPLFDAFGIEHEISRALNRTIWLKSGGYIVIEQTEALVVIDVNTGRYVGKGNQADTILKTNLEAVREIAYQIRLRNLGGIIIVDFIDMEKKTDRQTVLNALQEALKKDRAKTNISGISDLGLVQMTRKRIRENLRGRICEPCPHCEGRGSIRSVQSVAYEILRALKKEAGTHPEDKILVLAHPDVVSYLYDEERDYIEEIEKAFRKKIVIRADNRNHNERYDVFSH